MSYNFLRMARSIKNSLLCEHDTLNAYQSNIGINGYFDGWDVYNNIYLYGSWNGSLFGTSYERECYIGRTNSIIPVPAEVYYIVKVMMKITDNNNKEVGGLTTGKIRWITLNDNTWDSDKEEEFDLISDDQWHLYQINMGPVKDWQGDISNLRVYPFTDGWEKDQFAVKFVRISSLDTFVCTNTQCSYFTRFEHNCPGAGVRGSIEAGVSKSLYSTASGTSDKLIVNINGYGNEEFELGNNINLNGPEMARVISNALGILNVGSYAFSEVEYSELDKIKITSGSPGTHTSVSIPYSSAAEALGFYDNAQVDISTYETGVDPATGFDFAASRIFKAFEINKLLDGNKEQFAYSHDPNQFSVEGGRRDFSEIGNSRLLSDLNGNEQYESLNNNNRTIIDASHPINNNGRIKDISIFGKIRDDVQSKIKICRPKKDGTMEVIHSFTFDPKLNNVLYTKRPLTYRVDTDVLVEKGDLIGVYNADIYVGVSITGLPDASFYQYSGEVSGTFDPGRLYSFGVAGLAIYAKGDRRQTNAVLDIDMGDRVNIEQVDIYGKEESEYFEFNLASCLDVTWDVNLYGQDHFHGGYNLWTGQPFYNTHTNLYYGKETLDDMITTPDGGQVGDSYTSNQFDTGITTLGTHTYFYVNGDAEWLYSGDPNEIAEYHWPYDIRNSGGFARDPISFTMLFPNETTSKINKSIIYFKEDDNFRHLELSYYLGSKSGLGNAYKDVFFKRIPSYTSITMDGLIYDDANKESVEAYVFNNPMSSDAIYSGGEVQNPETVKVAHRTHWNIIEHNFNDVECKGFRIYTDGHNSTKIMEMELYSRVQTDPSLLDNMTMSFSDYGVVWRDVAFEELEEGLISGFIGGSPRYFRLAFESTNEFDINEVDFFVGDQLKLPNCDDTVLLEESKINNVNDSTSVDIKNLYDKPFDLIIDLPKEVDDSDGLIFWSKLESEDDIENPDIGPACFLRKEDNYDILNDNNQCAINVPAYGLKNLVDGKKSYYSQDSMEHWQSFGTLTSGTSLDFCTNNYRKTEFTFNPVSASHWKIGFPLIVRYEDDFLMNPNWSNWISGTSLATFTWSSGRINFNTPSSNTYHHIFYKSLNGSITNSDATEIRFKIRITGGTQYYEYQTIGLVDTGTSWPKEGFALEITYQNGPRTFRLMVTSTGGGSRDVVTIAAFSLSTDYYVKLLSNGSGGYSAYIWTDTWDGSSLLGSALLSSSRSWSTNKVGITSAIKSGVGIGNGTFSGWIDDVGVYSPTTPIVDIKYIDAYYDDVLVPLETVYFNSNVGASAQSSGVISDGVDMDPAPGIYAFNTAIGLGFSSVTPIDRIRIIHNSSQFFNSVDVYINYVNDNNYFLWDDEGGSLSFIHDNDTYDTYFVIDLDKRHKLDIIRNYGDAANKLLLDGSNTDHSSTNLSVVDSVVWGNSDIDDTRWIRVSLLTGDGTTRCLRKLGIYPDISQNAAPGGGYNCEWQSMGNILSDYNVSINVAYGAVVTGTNNYFAEWYPTNAVDGVHDEFFENECWGFQAVGGVDPYIEINFGQVYTIDRAVLYHGYNPGDSTYMNTDYNISVSTSTSGSFTQILSVTNNNTFDITHEFDPVEARRLRLTITDYDYGTLTVQNLDGDYEVFKGSFFREIEIYTYPNTRHVDSESWPVMITYLNQPFLVTNHDISNIVNAPAGTGWDNDEQFFRYSDDVFDDPQKASFYTEGQYVIVYFKSDTSGDAAGQQIYWQGNTEYLFDQNVFLSEGTYRVNYDAYDADTIDEISLRFEGPQTVDFFATNTGNNTWSSQDDLIQIPEDGFYDIKGVQHIDFQDIWGVRNPLVRIIQGETMWVSITRDTATNYSYDDDSGKYGIDTIDKLKIYGDRKYRPTEYHWWWSSVLSTLSNDAVNTKVGNKSLQIDYPPSSGTDTIAFIEGDDFGQDDFWATKDVLQFWWKIDDVSKLDTTIGDITFGSVNRGNPFYYVWDIEHMSLSSGWNLMKLKFDEHDHTFPEVDGFLINQFLDSNLDFSINGKDMKSFRIRFKGLGQAFTTYIDDIHIERNVFEDDVHFGKGLCLVGREMLEIPVAGLTLEKGAVEFWLKTYYDSYGRDAFGNSASKTLFTLTNNNNDVISLGLKAGAWFEPVTGNIRSGLNKFDTEFANLIGDNLIEVGGIVHLALVWSSDGKLLDNDDTVRLYLNGEAIYASQVKWEVNDTKSVNIKFGGSNTQLAYNRESYGAGIFDNIKLYNFPKTEFNPYQQDISRDVTYTPNEFLEVSPDNINFYGVESANLPIIFEQVPAGDTKIIYLRSNKNDNFLQSKKTASLVVQWLTTV